MVTMNKLFVFVAFSFVFALCGCKFSIKDFTSAVGELTAETKTVK